MFVDTDLLRMGAGFSDSAGEIASRGAQQLGSSQISAGIFGDFAEAEQFHNALSRAHDTHTQTMQGHQESLTRLASKATAAATIFAGTDQNTADSLDKTVSG
jgi:hypothetical protein